MSAGEARLVGGTTWTIAALLVLRLVAAAYTPLTFDEAYYWTWSKHLAGGFYDHPPMVAIVIRLGTWIAGDTELGVRLVSILLAIPMSFAVYRSAEILFGGRRVAATATILLNVTLMASVGTMIVTPDAPRHHDRHARRAASGRFQFCPVLSRQGVGDRPRRLVACGRGRGRRGAALEIHRAVFRARDPDMADRGPKTAALAGFAMAVSRRHRCVRNLLAGHCVECRAPMGVAIKTARPCPDRGFYAWLYRRSNPDPDRGRDAFCLYARRDGALRAVETAGGRDARARAHQLDVLDHHGVFPLALAAQPRRG
jgi:hypothetical protein